MNSHRLDRIARNGLIAATAAFAITACASVAIAPPMTAEWRTYGGNSNGDRFSPLTQINRGNVARLREVWRFDMGAGGIQTSPLMFGDLLYTVTPQQDVVALNAATGQQVWTWDAPEPGEQPVRGLSLWEGDGGRRLFTSNGPFLVALDAATGQPVQSFGKAGRIDLREGLGRDPASISAFLTSPGTIFEDLIITGFRTSESHPAAPGAVRAYDVRTGAIRWTFNLIPRPGEAGHESWPVGAWKTAGAANSWPGMVVNAKRGILFVPTGSAVDDFYGGDRPGDNLYASSLVALDVRTGRKLWHFQGVHHDIWDRDFPAPPVLVSVVRDGKRIDAVAQTSKQGFVFLFDQATGRPLFPIVERPVVPSDVPGEQAAPTQPHALRPAPFARQWLTEEMLTNRTPEAHAAALAQFRTMRSGGPFLPFTIGKDRIVFPGFDGGAEWGGPAVDPSGTIYINSNDIAWLGALKATDAQASAGERIYQEQCSACHGDKLQGSPPQFPALAGISARMKPAEMTRIVQAGRGRMPGFPHIKSGELNALLRYLGGDRSDKQEVATSAPGHQARYRFTGYRKWLDADGYPAVAPPWGTLSAIDLNSGDYRWRVTLGDYPELAAKGMATGSENYGGPVVTAGGVLIIGATIYDRKLRAFDTANGALLWEKVLPYAGTATPITYMLGGKQYIVVATSNSRNPKAQQGSAYVAFALAE
ncbi:MAG: PQQ-binding-like beta-propeller repeat protein [Sphingomicrobium sp.]